jgi:hemolysin activation/secretion protein
VRTPAQTTPRAGTSGRRRVSTLRLGGFAAAAVGLLAGTSALGGEEPSPSPGAGRSSVAAGVERMLAITEFRVTGVTQLSEDEIDRAVYPFLGPVRKLRDVEGARAALEKAYLDRGFHAVRVSIPPQQVRDGVVALEVTEGKVGRLRVRGSRWFALSEIKRQAPSLAEGTALNFNDIVGDLAALNALPDRRVTPSLRPTSAPGLVDADLIVEDKLPLHGSIELNDRHGPDTTRTRILASARYDNLWQAGHSLGLSVQVAPERVGDGLVAAGYYSARLADAPGLTFSVNGVYQDSDVSTLGGTAVVGRGRTIGARAGFTLLTSPGFFDNLSVGIDWKQYQEVISLSSSSLSSPITYAPIVAQYGAIWSGERSQTQLTATLTTNLRGTVSSSSDAFDNKRYGASGAFMYARVEGSRGEELPRGFRAVEKVQLQLTGYPLVGPEQLTAGGIESLPGYLEAQIVGDRGAVGRVELWGPSLARGGSSYLKELRAGIFTAGAALRVNKPLPDQEAAPSLWSAGALLDSRFGKGLVGQLALGVPMRTAGTTRAYHPRLHFRVAAEF